MKKENLKEMQETIEKINRCYQTYDYKLKICLPLPNGNTIVFVTYYQDVNKFKKE